MAQPRRPPGSLQSEAISGFKEVKSGMCALPPDSCITAGRSAPNLSLLG